MAGDGGNGVSTARPPRAPARSITLDWDDIPAIAELLLQNLDQHQRQALASLIIAGS